MLLHDIRGYDHVKRALEVALVGDFSTTIMAIGPGYQVAEQFEEFMSRFGLNVDIARPCACGNLGSPSRACICTEQMKVDQRIMNQSLDRNSVWTVVSYVNTDTAFINASRVEQESTYIDRTKTAKQRMPDAPSTKRDDLPVDCRELLRSAIRQLDFGEKSIDQVISVASVIAVMDRSAVIRPRDIAEAIQYRPRVD